MRRNSSGQASIEYVAVLAVVAGVFALLAATTVDTAAMARRVTREVARTLCLVRAGDCRRDQEPCVMAADGRRRESHVNLLVFRLGGDTTILVEERSDGTFAVTHAPRDLAGLEVGLGGDLGLDTGGFAVGVSAELQAALLARLGEGRTWIVPSRARADALLAALGEEQEQRARERRDGRAPSPVPPPDITYDEDEVRASLGLAMTGAAGAELFDARAALTATRGWGTRVDRRTGHRTLFLSAANEGSAEGKGGGGLLDESKGFGGSHETYAVELDAAGRPVDLAVTSTGTYDGSADLPGVVSPIVGRLAVPAGRGHRTYEVTAHLDLTVPGHRAAAQALIATIGTPTADGARLRAASAVRERLERDGTVEARVLATEQDDRGIQIHGAGGLKVGGGMSRETWSTRLVSAASRGLDGEWLMRADCTGDHA